MAKPKYLLINKTKKQYLHPNVFGEKDSFFYIVMENDSVLLKALGYLLTELSQKGSYPAPLSGYWSGDEISLVNNSDVSKIYQTVLETYTDISSNIGSELISMDSNWKDTLYMSEYARNAIITHIKKHPPIPNDLLSVTGRVPSADIQPVSESTYDPTVLEIL